MAENTLKKDTTDKPTYPEKIRMSGLPFMLQGWNTEFVRTSEESDGCPVYYLEPYNLYWLIPIIGGYVKRVKGNWIFQRECDWDGIHALNKKRCFVQNESPDLYPYGPWTFDAFVKAVN